MAEIIPAPGPCDKCGCGGEQQYELVLAVSKKSDGFSVSKILDHGPALLDVDMTKDQMIQRANEELGKL